MRYNNTVMAAPILQLFAGIRKAHEPMGVQVFGPELTAEGLDEAIIRRLS